MKEDKYPKNFHLLECSELTRHGEQIGIKRLSE